MRTRKRYRKYTAMPQGQRLAVLSGHLAQGGATRSACAAPVVVGGCVMDVQAHPSGPVDVCRGGSVPGRIVQSAGGVARNIAESLALLARGAAGGPAATPPLLVSVVGDDLPGKALLAHLQVLGLPTSAVTRVDGRTPMVAVVFDAAGEVAACVADVGLLESHLTPALLRARAPDLAAAPLVLLDGNLSPEAIEEACRIAAGAGRSVWFEPVSAAKSVRAVGALRHLAYVSPNQRELVAMAEELWRRGGGEGSAGDGQGSSLRCPRAEASEGASAEQQLRGLRPHLAALLGAGVGHVVLTLGSQGAALCTLSSDRRWVEATHLPAVAVPAVVNCSGAGDCLVAGMVFGLLSQRPPLEALAAGVAAAAAAVQSAANVPAGLSAARVLGAAPGVLRQATSLCFPIPD